MLLSASYPVYSLDNQLPELNLQAVHQSVSYWAGMMNSLLGKIHYYIGTVGRRLGKPKTRMSLTQRAYAVSCTILMYWY